MSDRKTVEYDGHVYDARRVKVVDIHRFADIRSEPMKYLYICKSSNGAMLPTFQIKHPAIPMIPLNTDIPIDYFEKG